MGASQMRDMPRYCESASKRPMSVLPPQNVSSWLSSVIAHPEIRNTTCAIATFRALRISMAKGDPERSVGDASAGASAGGTRGTSVALLETFISTVARQPNSS